MPAPAELIASLYDPEAHYRTKRSVEWVGYQNHTFRDKSPSDAARLLSPK